MTSVLTSPVATSPHANPRPARRRPGPATRLRAHRTLLTVTIAVIVLVQVYPLVWLLLTSFRTAADFAGGNPFALPSSFTLENYSRAFATGNLWVNVTNSFIVTIGASVLIVVAGMMAAYALQVLGFRLSGLVRAVFLMGIVVPVQISLVPLFIDYSQVGLLDTHLSMIVPLAAFALPMAVYLFSSFYEYIPRETYEAASLDGAGPYRIFSQITLRLSTNTIITVVLVNSIFIWNDFIFANTFVLSDGLKTIPLGLQNYIGAMGNTDWTATFAAVCVTVTPLLLVFLVLNKAMIQGLESGAVKG
ncbi:ABC transporter permease [Cellulomonas hominis]|uniref:ABC transporter permease n=1 Tax=Cellulomonas hominis TaxID=156981 RepID=A0A511FEJ6_9CELL|nr:carbohydrate ABC transporter permease [Cellulomonas hominis]MBB5473315.1 raffinose/stachyose/melibiose transport system permease protein [Cellulomonas hominis]GEL47689.1 ABC transporter permease [Cellulomonas hominis]